MKRYHTTRWWNPLCRCYGRLHVADWWAVGLGVICQILADVSFVHGEIPVGLGLQGCAFIMALDFITNVYMRRRHDEFLARLDDVHRKLQDLETDAS